MAMASRAEMERTRLLERKDAVLELFNEHELRIRDQHSTSPSKAMRRSLITRRDFILNDVGKTWNSAVSFFANLKTVPKALPRTPIACRAFCSRPVDWGE